MIECLSFFRQKFLIQLVKHSRNKTFKEVENQIEDFLFILKKYHSQLSCDYLVNRVYNYFKEKKWDNEFIKFFPSYQNIFEKKLSNFIEFCIKNNSKLIIYGIGKHTQNLLKTSKILKTNILGFSDTNFQLNSIYYSYPVLEPITLKELDVDFILISSKAFEREIFNELRSFGIPEGKIVCLYSD